MAQLPLITWKMSSLSPDPTVGLPDAQTQLKAGSPNAELLSTVAGERAGRAALTARGELPVQQMAHCKTSASAVSTSPLSVKGKPVLDLLRLAQTDTNVSLS